MKTKDRQNKILAYLRAMQRQVSIEELSVMLHVSQVTIRRDLHVLEKEQAIIRTHGGCMNAGRIAMETEYHKKVARNFDLKQAIGGRAAEEVREGEVILVDDGSTTFHIAAHLGRFRSLSVYTNSFALVPEIKRFPGISLSILGGEVDADRYSVLGYLTEDVIERIRFDKVFIGVDAIDASGKCYVKTEALARLARVMLKSGKEKILLSDHTKVGLEEHFSYGTLDDFDKWITTPGIGEKQMGIFKKLTRVIVA